MIVPAVLPVKLTEQLVELPLPARVQLALVGETPAPFAVAFTAPVGPVAPEAVSVTVIVQLLGTVTRTGLVQLTLVVVVCRGNTVNAAVRELVAWLESLS